LQEQYRQGDVLLIRVANAPAGRARQAEGGRLILARGEKTGHHHSVLERDAQLVDTAEGVFLKVGSQAAQEAADDAERQALGRYLYLEDRGGWRRRPGARARALATASPHSSYTTLVHQEHQAILVPPGTYQVVQQREYRSARDLVRSEAAAEAVPRVWSDPTVEVQRLALVRAARAALRSRVD
jgi:hypothetical protein